MTEWTALLCAINYANHHCNEWAIRDLLIAGADPDAKLDNGQSCLHLAAQLNPFHAAAVTRLLLQHGATAETKEGEVAPYYFKIQQSQIYCRITVQKPKIL